MPASIVISCSSASQRRSPFQPRHSIPARRRRLRDRPSHTRRSGFHGAHGHAIGTHLHVRPADVPSPYGSTGGCMIHSSPSAVCDLKGSAMHVMMPEHRIAARARFCAARRAAAGPAARPHARRRRVRARRRTAPSPCSRSRRLPRTPSRTVAAELTCGARSRFARLVAVGSGRRPAGRSGRYAFWRQSRQNDGSCSLSQWAGSYAGRRWNGAVNVGEQSRAVRAGSQPGGTDPPFAACAGLQAGAGHRGRVHRPADCVV